MPGWNAIVLLAYNFLIGSKVKKIKVRISFPTFYFLMKLSLLEKEVSIYSIDTFTHNVSSNPRVSKNSKQQSKFSINVNNNSL